MLPSYRTERARRGHPRRGPVAALALALAVGLLGCAGESSEASPNPDAEAEREEDAIAVRVEHLRRFAVSSTYTTSGTLRADKRATVTARTQGVIQELRVEEGDLVEAGRVLAILEDAEQRITFESAESASGTKRREFERARQLHEQGLMADEAFDATRRDAEEARHTAELAELELSRTVIRAPFSGQILRRHLDVGATVTDGSAIYDLADLAPLYADVNVPERQIGRLAPGQSVRLSAGDAGADATARIERIAPLVDPETGTIKVTLAVEEGSGLRPGSFIHVEIVVDTHEAALVVPRSALVAEGSRWHLYRLDEGGRNVQRLEVTLGFEDRDRVEILEVEHGALAPSQGDRIVIVGASALTDGARVQVVEGDPEPGDTNGEDDGVTA